MARVAYWPFLAAFFVVAGALPATADEWWHWSDDKDDLKSVLADCKRPDLSPSDIDMCLERVRVLSETDGSPQLQTLTAHLEGLVDAKREETARATGTDPKPADSDPPPQTAAAPHA